MQQNILPLITQDFRYLQYLCTSLDWALAYLVHNYNEYSLLLECGMITTTVYAYALNKMVQTIVHRFSINETTVYELAENELHTI